MLASFVAVSGMASNASRRVVGQWGGAGGAICEDHFCLAAWRWRVFRDVFAVVSFLVPYMPLANSAEPHHTRGSGTKKQR